MNPRIFFLIVLCSFWLQASSGLAQSLAHGDSPVGQPGVVRTLSATPSVHRSWHFFLGGGYGWQPNVLDEGDSRQHASARLVIGFAPWSFFQFSLSADSVIEGYSWPEGIDNALAVGALGDPRFSIRTGWSLGSGFSLGAYADIWIPSGAGSFNIVGGSLSPSIVAMASFTPERIPIGVHLNVGYRHNRSIYMLTDVSQLTREQLLLSGATSAMHSLDLAMAIEYRFGPAAPFFEVMSDLSIADGMDKSFAMIGFGARIWLGPADAVQLLFAMEFRVTPTPPEPDPVAGTVWRAPPLLNVHVGVGFRLPVRAERGESSTGTSDDRPGQEDHPEDHELGRISGVVRCSGEACDPTVRVRVLETGSSAIAPDDGTGAFTTAELPAGTYEVEALAAGRNTIRQQVIIEEGETARVEFNLVRAISAEPSGIRGQVTDFQRQPVVATIRIPALDRELTSGEDGTFETEAEPGEYQVIISAPGYRTQHSRAEVPPEGMVIMNIELRGR